MYKLSFLHFKLTQHVCFRSDRLLTVLAVNFEQDETKIKTNSSEELKYFCKNATACSAALEKLNDADLILINIFIK